MILKKNRYSIFEIKKFLKNSGFEISKKKNNQEEKNSFGALSRTFLSSLIIISIFFITPLVIDLSKKNIIFSKNFENNSKNNMKKLLDNGGSKLDDGLDENFLFEDILVFDEQPTDTVRLSASTI